MPSLTPNSKIQPERRLASRPLPQTRRAAARYGLAPVHPAPVPWGGAWLRAYGDTIRAHRLHRQHAGSVAMRPGLHRQCAGRVAMWPGAIVAMWPNGAIVAMRPSTKTRSTPLSAAHRREQSTRRCMRSGTRPRSMPLPAIRRREQSARRHSEQNWRAHAVSRPVTRECGQSTRPITTRTSICYSRVAFHQCPWGHTNFHTLAGTRDTRACA